MDEFPHFGKRSEHDASMKYVTIRNLPSQVADALKREKQRQHKSLNQIAIELLAQALGVNQRSKQGNGLATLAGGWTDQQWKSFEESVAVTEQVDEALWR
jgi:plasmid stability protein